MGSSGFFHLFTVLDGLGGDFRAAVAFKGNGAVRGDDDGHAIILHGVSGHAVLGGNQGVGGDKLRHTLRADDLHLKAADYHLRLPNLAALKGHEVQIEGPPAGAAA